MATFFGHRHINAHDFLVIPYKQMTVGKCGSLASRFHDRGATESVKFFGTGFDDHNFTGHRGEEQFSVGPNQVTFPEMVFLPHRLVIVQPYFRPD